jgi:acylphosphatase
MTPSPTPPGPPRRLEAIVFGLVQGVGFRWFVQDEASRLGLAGWTANRSDGSVEVVAEGPESVLAHLVDAMRDGPPGASVSRVDVRHEPARGDLVGFIIRSGSHRGD